ncbi:hypothetical protein, partial [Mesorhizobium sp. M1204]
MNAALGHHLFQIAQAEIVGKIPANAQQDHGSIKMAAFEHDKLPEKRASVMQQMTFPKSLRQNPKNSALDSSAAVPSPALPTIVPTAPAYRSGLL